MSWKDGSLWYLSGHIRVTAVLETQPRSAKGQISVNVGTEAEGFLCYNNMEGQEEAAADEEEDLKATLKLCLLNVQRRRTLLTIIALESGRYIKTSIGNLPTKDRKLKAIIRKTEGGIEGPKKAQLYNRCLMLCKHVEMKLDRQEVLEKVVDRLNQMRDILETSLRQ